LGRVVDPEETAAILRRALEYPYATPERSYLYRDGTAAELPAEGPELAGREPLLAYGANAAPEALAYKLASLPSEELPVIRAELEGFDVVYSAHVSPYGAVPATLKESAGTTAPVFVVFPNRGQLELLTAYEANYELVAMRGVCCRLVDGTTVEELAAYRSVHGCLHLDGGEVALAAVRSRGRKLPELDEPAMLERVRAQLAPGSSLEDFVVACVARGGIKPLPRLSSP
jgi:hypothetical protein